MSAGPRIRSSSSRTCQSPSTVASGWSARPDCRWLRRHGRLPQRKGRPRVRGARRRHAAEVPSLRAWRRSARLRAGVRVLVPRDCQAGAPCSSHGKFDVLQACNPPDIFWPIARWLRRRDSSRFVSTTTTSVPSSMTPGSRTRALPKRGLLALEKATFHTADHVVATQRLLCRDRDAAG